MSEREILEALQTATRAAVEACPPPSNALPIKYLGRTFVIPDDQKWLELVHLPNNITGEFWGSSKTYRGTLRLILHWPNNDQGVYSPIDIIEQIGSFFAKGKSLQSGQSVVKIDENPDYFGSIETGTETVFVLTVRYQSFAAE
ncbi:phage tail terminator-like protein [Mesorhizobium sp. M1A.F.Ca.ET.072.01.1.1]|uniref:phage tail terminator-like protein n=1 Tax=Mesorhizobium sp. M1A.F.Ca.ET.072.01.1.1 TaxID=2496753 RepID=UPI00167569DE|nr:phage tail terminator-like protein [Mesorhizobium sp. M1A.F.Ca.ET.072.01.1.1]